MPKFTPSGHTIFYIAIVVVTMLAQPTTLGRAAEPAYDVVKQGGADPTGLTDSAEAFQRAVALSSNIFVPSGVYKFASIQAVPCCAADPTHVLISYRNSFSLIGSGAVIVIAPEHSLSSAFHFSEVSNLHLQGLTIVGDRSGLSDAEENVGLALTNVSAFKISDISFSGDFSGNGAAVAGDWLSRGVLENLTMSKVSQCLDFAFVSDIGIKGLHASGDGLANHRGSKCVSIVNDHANKGTNRLPAFPLSNEVSSENVDVSYSEITNFDTGVFLAAGVNVDIHNNKFYLNNMADQRPCIGIYIVHKTNGPYKSDVGEPTDVHISANVFIRQSSKGVARDVYYSVD